ncbi:MAG: class I SAM-dependent RNA methyltransferase [Syntrophales bacterium]|nr:class I SAM-dependent RNA methyltransferase [Syntrophales bacterium]MDY0044380.1 class I SAM-dependent RNA methyltransferase [Syntrophales bacterium]
MPFTTKKSTILVTCSRGISSCLEKEILGLGFPLTASYDYGVETEGTLADSMLLNLWIRTGQRVYYLIKSFNVRGIQDLYRGVYSIPWEDYIDESGYVSVHSVTNTPFIANSQFANLKCKDALVDRFYSKMKKRPDSGPLRRRTVLFLYCDKTRCSLYFDTSGESLSRRGYRIYHAEAPLQEALAAALIYESRWNPGLHFINPMCGSGTLAIEAALMQMGKAPGLFKSNFGFMHIKGYEKNSFNELRNFARARIATNPSQHRIIATDINKAALESAKRHAERAAVGDRIEFTLCDFRDTPIPPDQGIIMMNPEYGKRLGHKNALFHTYHEIGNFLKKRGTGYRAFIFTGTPELAKNIGLKPVRKTVFYNGPIECRLIEYDLYKGSKRIIKK